ncbi:MAG: Hpt domain-containing protein [Vicinamibacterales bacterium]|nr:Hpt domain-containing protein [Vicinamibacterales bacterium]
MPSDEVLDPAVVAELRRAQDAFGKPEFVRQLAGLFLASAPGKMDRIRQAFTAGDAAAIRELAHALKSNCGMLGATRMAGACALMEGAAARADLAAAAAAFRDVERDVPGVLHALSTLE